jgi:hypothetical protein
LIQLAARDDNIADGFAICTRTQIAGGAPPPYAISDSGEVHLAGKILNGHKGIFYDED